MKKKAVFASAALIFAAAATITSYAYYTRTKSIPSVTITVNTGELNLGDDLTDDAYAYVSVSDSNVYYELEDAEWIDDITQLKVGDAPRMQVYLSAIPKESESTNYTTIYLFEGSYNSGNVTIRKGELLAADIRNSGYSLLVTIRIDAVKGTYDDPVNAYWNSPTGTGYWTVDYNDSGYYDIYLYRGSKVVKKLNDYQGTSYDFYPYMTEDGDYQFKVRTVPVPGSDVGKASDWTESSTLTINSSQVSDGTGQTDADENGGSSSGISSAGTLDGIYLGDTYGWINVGDNKYFRYPDGTVATGWINLNGTYYRFDSMGVLQTGWVKNDYGYWFYLESGTGAMHTGWLNDGGTYYYLSKQNGDNYGTMVTGWAVIDGNTYYFDENGKMVTGWTRIGGSYYYFYPESSGDTVYGSMAVNTTIGDFTVGADGSWTP